MSIFDQQSFRSDHLEKMVGYYYIRILMLYITWNY